MTRQDKKETIKDLIEKRKPSIDVKLLSDETLEELILAFKATNERFITDDLIKRLSKEAQEDIKRSIR